MANETRTAGPGSKLIAPVPFDSRRVRARRAIVRELDEWFGIFRYPDPNDTYAAAPSREVALDG